MRKSIFIVIFAAALAFFASNLFAEVCVDCHTKVTPHLVSDWKLSKHSEQNVGCAVCHGDGRLVYIEQASEFGQSERAQLRQVAQDDEARGFGDRVLGHYSPLALV